MSSEWRRKYARISCFLPTLIRFPLVFEYHSEKGLSDGWGVIHDISLGGIKFESRELLNKGQKVFISFTISNNFIFTNAPGIITRIIKNGIYYTYGIQFESLVDQQHLKDALEDYFITNKEK
ncbi:MAG TPA: hypothetical protein DEE98_07840 [Elusimicrobia bacterium]|nr:MAG: hypothetical protein A2278_00675 [Elusimicrobia bacterium RIFOXYA12_FULL_49_49]OGS09969.1 MAG: hypothetical protein A2204_06030 [Elusimicrobia bacterium RIFOXYA1_FULL_47_7]OGS10994.1 MAG: hypothetical protein A2386_00230 [Elusimicrobia bacterium RIFOXYB1_FULL_48_9]OGS15170.1 MAG: hypothetical protein A2251_00685 [Elusimicrobia bacterium RIFOXYA2_FULL_47_53]OGS29790.1 MAG: hypothetical protein A2323_01485 [Elusimicrobia bacterium RIFOXYB2_FULL_46_23]HBU70273.1 hypothetical protein [Elus